jgi:hypothetical protein
MPRRRARRRKAAMWRNCSARAVGSTRPVINSLAQRTAAKAGPIQHRGDRVATDLEPALEQARQALLARARFRATWCPNSPWVFCCRDGHRIESVKAGFNACARDAQLKDVHPHDLRRTFGSGLLQAGWGSSGCRNCSATVTLRSRRGCKHSSGQRIWPRPSRSSTHLRDRRRVRIFTLIFTLPRKGRSKPNPARR